MIYFLYMEKENWDNLNEEDRKKALDYAKRIYQDTKVDDELFVPEEFKAESIVLSPLQLLHFHDYVRTMSHNYQPLEFLDLSILNPIQRNRMVHILEMKMHPQIGTIVYRYYTNQLHPKKDSEFLNKKISLLKNELAHKIEAKLKKEYKLKFKGENQIDSSHLRLEKELKALTSRYEKLVKKYNKKTPFHEEL